VRARRLIVNVDHVATVRQARGGVEPEPVAAAALALAAGAEGIVVHLREDRRHIQDRDVRLLRQTVHGHFVLEMAPTHEMLKIALDVRPNAATLVPERREELTTEGGLDAASPPSALGEVVRGLRDAGIRACVFVNPEVEQIKAAHRMDADAVEIHTGRYATRFPDAEEELARIRDAARLAAKLGLGVGAGHGLDSRNLRPVAAIEEIEEFSIGHAVIAHALLVGMDRAVSEIRRLIG
jgi:pyridoxine 5-phosphate synthase